jgi:DNA-binding CsgD family transcriptional regulator
VRVRAGLRHPFGLALLLAGVMLAAAMTLAPPLAPWSTRAAWVLGLGILAYLAVAAVVAWPERRRSAPELVTLSRIRESIAIRLAERQVAERGVAPTELTRLLTTSLRQLDEHLMPAFGQLVARHASLNEHLARYRTGDLPPPDGAVLDRLLDIHARQRDTIASCVRRSSSVDAALLALVQESDVAPVSVSAERWVGELLAICDSISEALQSGVDRPAQTDLGALAQLTTASPRPSASPLADTGQSVAPSVADAHPCGLTAREVEVLRLLADGRSNKEIAADLIVSVPTVQRHIANIYTKIDARNRADATAFALGHGIARPRG